MSEEALSGGSLNGDYRTLSRQNPLPVAVRGFCLFRFITTLEKW